MSKRRKRLRFLLSVDWATRAGPSLTNEQREAR